MRLLVLLLFLLGNLALATETLGRFQNSKVTDDLVVTGLEEVCGALPNLHTSLPCNPAFIVTSGGTQFVANTYLADDYDRANEYRKLLDSKREVDLVRDLFSKEQSVSFRGGISMWFRGQGFGLSVTPYRFKVDSLVRNEVLPKMQLAMFEEREIRGQFGKEVLRGLSLGLNLRLIDRQFIIEDAQLFDAILNFEQTLEKRKQTAFVVEPGLVYQFQELKWNPILSVQMIGYSFVNRKYAEIETRPAIDLGMGISPMSNRLGYGLLSLGVNYRYRGFNMESEKNFSFGLIYSLGLVESFMRLSGESLHFGVVSAIERLRVGLLYKQKLSPADSDGEITGDRSDLFLEVSYLL